MTQPIGRGDFLKKGLVLGSIGGAVAFGAGEASAASSLGTGPTVELSVLGDTFRVLYTEGAPDSGWVLIDFGDAIVHLFAREERDYYRIEDLWTQGVSVVHLQ